MNSSRFIISILTVIAPLSAWGSMPAADSVATGPSSAVIADTMNVRRVEERPYDRRVRRYRKKWDALIPTQVVVQNAGNMGAVSMGIGWDYGRHRQWETQFLLGYLPKYQTYRGKLTLTLKENFIPWSLPLKHGWYVEPLRCGLYVNTITGHEFWRSQPRRYPDKYYNFLSTKLRFNVFAGQGFEITIPDSDHKRMKSVTVFYEISTCDLYIRNMFMDSKVTLGDILGLSLGVKLLFF